MLDVEKHGGDRWRFLISQQGMGKSCASLLPLGVLRGNFPAIAMDEQVNLTDFTSEAVEGKES
jgi:hypothetical protein